MDRPAEVGSDTPTRPDDPVGRVRMSGPRIFSIAFVILFGAGAIWSAATPLLAAPDEPSQIIKAASVARGVWTARCYVIANNQCPLPPHESTSSALGFEGLPTFYDLVRSPSADPLHSQTCFKSKKEGVGAIPASCARTLNRPPTEADTVGGYSQYSQTYQARYPPLYYAIVGLPSRFGGSTVDIYLMRLVSAALSAIFLALAITAALVYSRNRLLIAGIVVAVTPMVLFLAGVVNPSGLEISSAIALWTAGAILVTERLDAPPKGLVAIVGISAATLESVRALSPLWLAITAAALLACAERRSLLRALRMRSVQLCLGCVTIFGVVALWWIVAVHATDLYLGGSLPVPASVPSSTIFSTALAHNRFYLPDMIGIFGWFDTYSPPFTFIVWYVLVGLLVVGAAVRKIRHAAVLVLLAAVVVVLPAIIVTSHAHIDGYTWSGRDALPIAVGLPILASALFGRGKDRFRLDVRGRRALPAVIVVAGLAQFAGFYESLRRYAVGTRGPIFGFLGHPSWQPPTGIIGSLVLEVAALAALSALYLWAARRRSDPLEALPSGSGDRSSVAVGISGSSVSAANGVEGAEL